MLQIDNTFEMIYLAGLVAGSVVRKLYTSRSRNSKARKKCSGVLDIALITAAGFGMMAPLFYLFTSWLDFADYDLPGWMGWVGTAAFISAIALLWRSHADLGLNWSATLQVKSEHSLVTHGVYHRIRHPMYAAHMLWAIAQGLLLENWFAGWALMLTFIPLYVLRVPKEERMMLEQFGREYRDYMAYTGRIIPRFWR